MSDFTQQLQNAIVSFAFRERFNDLGGLFKAVGGICHNAKMVHPIAIGNEPCGDRQAKWSALRIVLPTYGRTIRDRLLIRHAVITAASACTAISASPFSGALPAIIPNAVKA